MTSTLDRFKADLESLITRGKALQMAMQLECHGDAFRKAVKEQLKTKADAYLKELPEFKRDYQRWYTEAQAVVKQLIPDRLSDFVRYHEKPRTRKDVSYGNYCMEDYLQSLQVTRGGYEVVVDKKAAIPQFDQQVAIVEAALARFDSSLLDMRQVLQADLFDSELQAAEHLAKYKFFRAAGALAGVVLERHLGQVCLDHAVTLTKRNPTIADFNEALKSADVVDLPQWRFIQHLADVRNLCDHAKKPDPTAEQVSDLLAGTAKVIKTVL